MMIKACCVLHNICRDAKLVDADIDAAAGRWNDNVPADPAEEIPLAGAGIQAQRRLINGHQWQQRGNPD